MPATRSPMKRTAPLEQLARDMFTATDGESREYGRAVQRVAAEFDLSFEAAFWHLLRIGIRRFAAHARETARRQGDMVVGLRYAPRRPARAFTDERHARRGTH